MAELKRDIEYVKDTLIQNKGEHDAMRSEMRSGINELKQMQRDFAATADAKYASKTIEKFVYGAIGTIGTILISAIILLVLKFGPELMKFL